MISWIIPVHNTEKYLRECLDSVVTQKFDDYEVIIVDDGSTDQSGQICDEYEKKYDKVHVLHQGEEGVSIARNKAIKIAKGEYLAFMDSDDYVESNYLQKLYTTAISTKADIVVCNHRRVTENRELLEERPLTGGIKEYNTYEAIDALIDDTIIKSFVWDKLFRREVFEDVSFPVGRYNQDIAIMHEVFGNAKKIVRIDDVLYYYRQHSTSILNSRGEKLNGDQFLAFADRLNYIKENYKGLYPKMLKVYMMYAMSYYCWLLREKNSKQEEIHSKMKEYKQDIRKMKVLSGKDGLRYQLMICGVWKLVYGLVKK